MGKNSHRSYLVNADENGVPMQSHSERLLAGRRKQLKGLKLSEAGQRSRKVPGSLHGHTGKIHPRPAGTAVRPNKDTYR